MKFEDIAKDCPWQDEGDCMAKSYESWGDGQMAYELCNDRCAVWHFFQKITAKLNVSVEDW